MISSEIAGRYSLALFELAREQGKIDEIQQELSELVSVIMDTRLKDILFHPRIEDSAKKDLIEKSFSGQLAGELINFLYLLIDKKRIFFLPEIYRSFTERYKQERGIIDIEAASAVELSPEQKQSLEKKLQELLNKKINVTYRVAPELIGGLRLKIGDRVIDGSIQYHLQKIQERIRQLPVSMLGVNDHEVKS